MSMIVKDETAGIIVFTIDNNGQLAFGDGTPINMLTLNGVGIIDSNGHITHGANSNTANPASGSGVMGIEQQISITTIAGRQPNVQLDTSYPSNSYFIVFRDPNDPTQGGSESVEPVWQRTQCGVSPFAGGFLVYSNDFGDQYVTDPTSEYYDGSLTNNAIYTYRWI